MSSEFGNVGQRAVVKFSQMSSEKLEMSDKTQNNFAHSGSVCILVGFADCIRMKQEVKYVGKHDRAWKKFFDGCLL